MNASARSSPRCGRTRRILGAVVAALLVVGLAPRQARAVPEPGRCETPSTPGGAPCGLEDDEATGDGRSSRTRGEGTRRAARPPERSEPTRRSGRIAPPGDEVVERWSSLSEERKREIVELYRRIQKLPPEAREELMTTLRRLDASELRRRLARAERKARWGDPLEEAALRINRQLFEAKMRQLPAGERSRLAALDAEERRKYFCDRLAWERQQLLASLPPEVRTAAEALSPREQARFLRHYEGEETSRRVFPLRAERAYIARTPRATLATLLEAGEETNLQRPGEISKASWERWLKLEPYERLRVLLHLSPYPESPGSSRDRSESKERDPERNRRSRGE